MHKAPARPLHIGVLGGRDADDALTRAAETVGALIAQAGATLVCGGRGGVMAAACRGAFHAGGLTVGVLPGLDRADMNPWVRVPIVTGLHEGRNLIIVRSSDAVVAIGGRTGTLSEIAYALHLGVPVVGLATWELRQPHHPDLAAGPAIHRAPSPERAAALALRLAQTRADATRAAP